MKLVINSSTFFNFDFKASISFELFAIYVAIFEFSLLRAFKSLLSCSCRCNSCTFSVCTTTSSFNSRAKLCNFALLMSVIFAIGVLKLNKKHKLHPLVRYASDVLRWNGPRTNRYFYSHIFWGRNCSI